MITASEAARALFEIAFWLRLADAENHRSRAFARAARTILFDQPDLEWLRKTDRLQNIDGVGPSIAAVLRELVDTGSSSYLERLRPEPPAAAPGLDGYLGDLHSHTTWSDGRAPVAEMAGAAAARGYRYLAITDHSPRLRVVHGLDGTRLAAQRLEIQAAAALVPGLILLQGIEVDILEDGALDLPDGVLAGLDVVIASPHVKLGMAPAEMTSRMLRALDNPHVDLIGHPTGRKPGVRPGATYDHRAVFRRAAEAGVALEIDSDPARTDLGPELIPLALETGCMLALDSDAHAPEELRYVEVGAWVTAHAGVPRDRLLNFLPFERWPGRLSSRSARG